LLRVAVLCYISNPSRRSRALDVALAPRTRRHSSSAL